VKKQVFDGKLVRFWLSVQAAAVFDPKCVLLGCTASFSLKQHGFLQKTESIEPLYLILLSSGVPDG